jgi:Protein-tyrosine phosphatase
MVWHAVIKACFECIYSILSSFGGHCSAGVGRTGTFIVIDATLERIKHVNTIDIYGHVTCLRAQRNYMVQTEDQYVFIHDSVLEAVQSGNTEILARNLGTHIQKLSYRLSDGTTGMEHEFRVIQLILVLSLAELYDGASHSKTYSSSDLKFG